MPIFVESVADPNATLTLDAIWLNVAADPSDVREFPFVSSYQYSSSKTGETRVGASGRIRAFTKAGVPVSASVKLDQCGRDDIAWLEGRVGVVLCVRDDRGRKWFGVYWSVPVEESVDFDDRGDVSLSIDSVSFSEAV